MMCHNRRLYPLWILLLFVVLYIGKPVFEQTWMYMGLGAALLIGLHIMNSGREGGCKISTAYWIALIVYQLHQFEEHGIDLMGNAYAFEGVFNHLLAPLNLGCSTPNGCPLNPENIFYINMLFIWLPLLIATHIAERRPFAAACYIGVIPSNALGHIIAALIAREYNPGVLTSVLLFLPFSFFYYRKAIATGYITKYQGIVSFLYGVLCHPFMLLMLIPTYVTHDYPTILYPVALLLYVFIPLLVSWAKCGACSSSCETTQSCCCCGALNCDCKCLASGCCSDTKCKCCSKKEGCGCNNLDCQCRYKQSAVVLDITPMPKIVAKKPTKTVAKPATKAAAKKPTKATPKKPKA